METLVGEMEARKVVLFGGHGIGIANNKKQSEWLCHVKIVPGAKIVPAYVISCLHLDNLPGNKRRDRLLPGRLQKTFGSCFQKTK